MASQKSRSRHSAKNRCQLEPLFRGVQEALTHDIADQNLRRLYTQKARGAEVQPLNVGAPPYLFKRVQQLLHFDKRIIWSTDRSFDSLATEALWGFGEAQLDFQCPEPMSQRATLVIQRAKILCAEILGEFDYDRWFDSCAFGKRAAVGLPRSQAYLDIRMERLSGTDLQWNAFKHMLARDPHLFRAVRKRTRSKQTLDHIKATAVPKSWKAARIIAPDTILGGLLSRGLGELLRTQLERKTHIDLAKQQERHNRWAKLASKTGHLATIDMSKASDSFVWRHIELLVPKSWHHALEIVRTGTVEVLDHKINQRSYMLMGSGHTFPLQTLLFYCLAEATRSLLKCRGRASVYGDDIIIPTRMSKPFIVVMSELGFVINSEKSFYDKPDEERPSHTFFRESCGGDYKGGMDVRPYMPECDLQETGIVPCNEYLAWCHKLINGLLDRWDPCEIPVTLGFLLRAINSKGRKICFVPEWEVDHSGIRHYIPPSLTFGLEVSHMSYEKSHPCYWRLTFNRAKRRRQKDERPYLWYSYWLQRNQAVTSKVPLIKLLEEEELKEKLRKLHSSAISLNGEPNRRKAGSYRWKRFGPQPLTRKR